MPFLSKLLFAFIAYLVMASSSLAAAPENGWWWNPSESGSGYAIERQGNSIFMAAFLYETSGAATWYATLLTLQPDGSYKGDMTRYVGGKSLLGPYKPAIPTTIVATATASFPKPDTGAMTIAFPNGAANRTIPISRFAFGSPSFEPSKGSFQSGWWWNDLESGTGYFIEVQGSNAFIASFMYDSAGQPTWYASLSSLSGTNLLTGPLDIYANGQALGGSYKAPIANAGGAGAMSYSFISDSLGSMTLPNLAKVAIKRFAFDPIAITNHAPIPNAGANQTVTVGDVVNLTGTGTDIDGDPLTFSWRLLSAPNASKATLNGWSTSKASFVADVAGTYRLELIADDGKVSNGGSVISVVANLNANVQHYVGVGFQLDPAGSLTNNTNEVITGTTSIKGEYNGSGQYTPYLHTNNSTLPLLANESYTVTFSYKILSSTSKSLGFQVLFWSPTEARLNNWLGGKNINGLTGDSGVATLTVKLGNYTDYRVTWNIIATGSISIDNIEIKKINSNIVVATEDGEKLDLQLSRPKLKMNQVRSFLDLVWNGQSDRPNFEQAVADSDSDLVILGSVTPINRFLFDPKGKKILI